MISPAVSAASPLRRDREAGTNPFWSATEFCPMGAPDGRYLLISRRFGGASWATVTAYRRLQPAVANAIMSRRD